MRGLIFYPAALIVFASWLLTACNSNRAHEGDIPSDSASIAAGKRLFERDCSACHNFEHDGIGPHLGGVTRIVSSKWLKDFIANPQMAVESGNARAQKLLARYKTLMPSFAHYEDESLNDLLSYLHTQAAPPDNKSSVDSAAIADPLPPPIASSNLVVDVAFVTEVPASATEGFKTRITKLDFIPGTSRLFIVDIRGKLYALQDNKPVVYMDMARLMPKFIDKPGLATGFGSFAFHPEFLKNGLLYTGHTEAPGSATADFHYADSIPVTLQWVVSEWKTETPSAFPFKGKRRELFRIDMVTGMHGVQEITFNPNSKPGDDDYGLLYIGIGDGACVQYGYPFLVQSIEKPWGSIFRIDPSGSNSANGKYGIPDANPFVGNPNKRALGEIYAYGFRNPHRITWSSSGKMLATNIGQAHIESVNLVLPGQNYGWAIREGTFLIDPYGDILKVYPLPENDEAFGITYPAAQYDHDEGAAITGGFEYTGTAIQALKGKYLFGDMNNGRLFYIDLADVGADHLTEIKEWKITHNGTATTTAALCGSKRVDLRFGKDHNGDVYFFSKQDGKVYRLAGATLAGSAL